MAIGPLRGWKMKNGNQRQAAVICALVASLLAAPGYSRQAQTPSPASIAPVPGVAPAAQAGPSRTLTLAPDYSNGQPSFFPHFTLPYTALKLPEPTLINSPRIDQLVQGGKLMLGLEDAISLALENNMEIAVQRFAPWLDEAALLRAKSGVNGRLAFDPVVTGQGYISKSSTPINNPFLAGVTSV